MIRQNNKEREAEQYYLLNGFLSKALSSQLKYWKKYQEIMQLLSSCFFLSGEMGEFAMDCCLLAQARVSLGT